MVWQRRNGLQKVTTNNAIPKSLNSADNLHIVYSFVYPNKKTNHPNLTPSGWLSTVGPDGLECDPLIMSFKSAIPWVYTELHGFLFMLSKFSFFRFLSGAELGGVN